MFLFVGSAKFKVPSSDKRGECSTHHKARCDNIPQKFQTSDAIRCTHSFLSLLTISRTRSTFVAFVDVDVYEGRGRVVGTAARSRAGRSGVSNPGRDKGNFSSAKRPDPLWVPSNLLFYGCREPLAGAQGPRRDVTQSLPPNTEITNTWSYISDPFIFLNDGEMGNFAFVQ